MNFFCDVFNKSFIFIDLLKTRRASEKTDRVFCRCPVIEKKEKPSPILIDFKLAYFGGKTGDALFVTLGNLVNFLDRRIDV